MSRSKIWAWTINARDTHPLETPTAPVLQINLNNVLFYKYQMERGESGRLHIQGCVRFSTMKSLEQVKSVLGCPWAHVEIARNWKALVEYCGKEETRVGGTTEAGNPGEQGKRTDLAAVATGIKAGMTPKMIAEQYPETFVKFHRGIACLAATLHEPAYRPHLKVFCLYGPAGVGKTYFVHKHYPDHYVVADMKSPWMDGYSNHKTVLFDDYGPNMMPIDLLKRFLDKYKCSAPFKGGFAPWNPDIIFITTNHRLGSWYNGGLVGDHDIAALERRMTWIELSHDRIDNEVRIVRSMRRAGIAVPNSDDVQDTPAAAGAAVAALPHMADMPAETIPEVGDDLSQCAIDLTRTDFVEPNIDQLMAMHE